MRGCRSRRVEWQIRVAAGEALPLTQRQVPSSGHAFEARIYAEDPAHEFLPSTGTITHLRWPATDDLVRVDTGVRAGDAVTVHYDPLLAKLVVHGTDRDAALCRLRRALGHCAIIGVTTNLALLRAVSAHPQFRAARFDTGFIAEHHAELFVGSDPGEDAALAASVALGWVLSRAAANEHSVDAQSPWNAHDGWRLNAPPGIKCRFVSQGKPVVVTLTRTTSSWQADVGGRVFAIDARFAAHDQLGVLVEGQRLSLRWLGPARDSADDGPKGVPW